MQRRNFIKNTALTIGNLALLNKTTLAAFLADPAYKIKMLTDDIGIFSEKGGTILFMFKEKGIVIVDAQFPDSALHCVDEIKKKTNKPFELLINTHHHADHTAGNIIFKGIVANIVAHKNSLINQTATAIKNKKENEQLYPTTTFDNTWSTTINNEKITLYYLGKGHTNGDIFVHFEKANIVHVGDLVFNRKYPYIDKNAGANITEWIKILTEAAAKFNDKTIYVCGHAANGYDVVISKTDVLAFRDYLQNLLKSAQEKINMGITKEEFMKTTEVPNATDWKGEGISRSLEAVWMELKEGM